MTSEALIDLLHGARVSGDGWIASCPAHDDRRPSLSVRAGEDGRILVKCHAGCDAEAIVRALGLSLSDLMPGREEWYRKARITSIYPYRAENGELLFEVVRLEPKGFRQRRLDGGGGWTWSTTGVRQVPYRLPELLATSGRRVFIVEGEKDADRIGKLGFVATTNAGGAGKWKPELSEALKNRHVIVLPDNDEPGRRHAELVGRSLRGVAASIRVLTLPNLPPRGDVSDWLDAGGTRDELKRLAKATPEWTPLAVSDETKPGPVLISLDSVRAEVVDWLWRDRVPFGKLTLLDGDPGLGKSTLALEIAARVTRGEALPGGDASRPMAVVISLGRGRPLGHDPPETGCRGC
jgi:putative DNA primase/helicase